MKNNRGKYHRTEEHKQTMNQHLKTGSMINCAVCGIEVYKQLSQLNRGEKHCSSKCAYKSPERNETLRKKNIGKVISESVKEKLRQYTDTKTSQYKNGRPSCKDCGKSEIQYASTYCNSCKGKHRTPEHKERLRVALSNSMKGKTPLNNSLTGKYKNIKRGWYDINGKNMFFRSKWEANYAMYLDYLLSKKEITQWTSENEIYLFEDVNYGTRSYKPDFNIVLPDNSIEHHEVKGYMDEKSQLKLNRMKLYYPDIKIILIRKEQYEIVLNELKSAMIQIF